MFALRWLEEYPFQLLFAAFLFASRMNKRGPLIAFGPRFPLRVRYWLRLILLGLPMLVIYDQGVRAGFTTTVTLLDRAILLLPVVYTLLLVWLCHDCGFIDALYYTITAAVSQNLVYNLHWIIITGCGIREGTPQSAAVAIPVMLCLYAIIYISVSRILQKWVQYSKMKMRLIPVAAVILLYLIFLNVRVTDIERQNAVYSAYILGDGLCLLVLFSLFYESGLEQKYQVMEQLLHAEQQKQHMARENVELINRKCHDLKHQIAALRMMEDSPERDAYIRELESAASFYEHSARTGNRMLDLLLMEKLLYCEAHSIRLSCIAEGDKLAFMDAMDLYSLFGNALDNAIESVMRETDEQNRVISFKVASRGQILSIHFENYIGHALAFVDGLPVTTKKDKQYHGFGMLSIRHIVEKYKGTLQISSGENLYQMNILMPIPDAGV